MLYIYYSIKIFKWEFLKYSIQSIISCKIPSDSFRIEYYFGKLDLPTTHSIAAKYRSYSLVTFFKQGKMRANFKSFAAPLLCLLLLFSLCISVSAVEAGDVDDWQDIRGWMAAFGALFVLNCDTKVLIQNETRDVTFLLGASNKSA